MPASSANFWSDISGNRNSVNVTSLPAPFGTTRIGFRISTPGAGLTK
jgi:hypothetical protein